MKTKRIIIYSLLAIAVVISGVFAVAASDTTNSDEHVIWVENIAEYRGETKTAPSINVVDSTNFTEEQAKDWVFAGWFTAEECTSEQALPTDKNDEGAFAKFVPAQVLGMKTQVGKNLIDNSDFTDDDSSSIRFITSVDSLNYSEIGFEIQIGDGTPVIKSSNIVYKSIYGQEELNGEFEVKEYTPENTFHAKSENFKTFKYTDVPSAAYNTNIKVTPLWITMDGTTVKSSESVVCVNKYRQWKVMFVNDPQEGQTDTGAGTYGNPYTTLDAALAHMNTWSANVEDKSGAEIIVKDNLSVVKTTTDTGVDGKAGHYAWSNHAFPVTIKGYDGTNSVLDFSNNNVNMMGGPVTFKELELILDNGADPAAFEARGNALVIEDTVETISSLVTIYGAGRDKDYECNTLIKLYTGTYRAIYGGGNGRNVKGNTHVELYDVIVYSADGRAVYGGGKVDYNRNANVDGNTKVIIGAGFNNSDDITDVSHNKYSSIWGGGAGKESTPAYTANVTQNTEVIVKDGAFADYVMGGGRYNASVGGTSKVDFINGTAYGVYGGGAGTGATNNNTEVIIRGGSVAQVFGGLESGTGMTGNANVQILGGTVTRRIYGGNYNEVSTAGEWASATAVGGTTNVTLKSFTWSPAETDNSICSISRLDNNDLNETGIMVVMPGVSQSDLGFHNFSVPVLNIPYSNATYTNYLVTVGEGGTVIAKDGVLHIEATDANKPYAKVAYGEQVLSYIKGKGTCELPPLENKTVIQNVTVTFGDTEEQVTNFVAKSQLEDGSYAYYPTLEQAVEHVNTYETATGKSTITLYDDVTVNAGMVLNKSVTITSDKGTATTISRGTTVTENMFDVEAGTFKIQGTETNSIIIEGNKGTDTEMDARAVMVRNGATLNMQYVTVQNFAKRANTKDGAAVYVDTGAVSTAITHCKFLDNSVSGGTGGALYMNASVTCQDSLFEGNTATGNGGAVSVRSGAEFKDDGVGNEFKNNRGNKGGAIIVYSGGSANLDGNNTKTFEGNEAHHTSHEGTAIFAQGTVTVKNYTFKDNLPSTSADVWVSKGTSAGTLDFDNITDAWIVQGHAQAKLNVQGYEFANEIEIKPNGEYALDKKVVTVATDAQAQFAETRVGIKVTQDDAAEGDKWCIGADGTLQKATVKVQVGDRITYSDTIEAAVAYANGVGGTGETADVIITVLEDVHPKSQMEITKNVTIQNAGTEEVSITRTELANANSTYVFKVASGGKLTLGSVAESPNGSIKIDGKADVGNTGRSVYNAGTFILGKNAIITNGKSAARGTALVNYGGDATLYGIITNNATVPTNSDQYGGAIMHITASATLTIHEGTYSNNTTSGGNGGFITAFSGSGKVTIHGGTFSENKATAGNGGFLATYGGSTEVEITGGTFTSNEGTNGGAIYVEKDSNVTISGGSFDGNSATKGGAIYVLGTLDVNDTQTETTADVTFEANHCTGGGGALWVGGSGVANVHYTEFLENYVQGNTGGAISVNGTGLVRCYDCNIEGNYTTGTTNGGAVYAAGTNASNKARFYAKDCQFKDNTSSKHGGAMILQANSEAVLEGTTSDAKFTENTCATGQKGSAIFVNSSATLYIKGYTFDKGSGTTQSINLASGTAKCYYHNLTGTLNTDYSFTTTPNSATPGEWENPSWVSE